MLAPENPIRLVLAMRFGKTGFSIPNRELL